MKKIVVYVVLLVSIALVVSCTTVINPNKQIQDKFLAMISDDGKTTFGNLFTQLAGIRGKVDYKVFTEQGETDPNIKIIQVDVDKQDSTVKYKTARFQYQFNNSTGFVKLRTIAINGEPQSIFDGSLTIGIMLLESSTN